MWDKMHRIGTWFYYKHHNTVEFFVCVFPNSTIILSKVYNRGTNNKVITLQSYFLDAWLRHSNIVANKGLNHFNECAARCVHLSPRRKSAPLLPKGTLKVTQLAP